MGTLTAGSSTSVALPAGQVLLVSGGYGTMQIAPPNQGPLMPVSPGGASIGPLSIAVTINLVSTTKDLIYYADDDGNPRNVAVFATDPLTGEVTALVGPTGIVSFPCAIGQSAVPVILAPNGTVAADGTITLGTALPTIYANAWVRLPAGAVVGGLAGLYFAAFSSTTVGRIKTNFVDASTAFTPYIPTGTVAAVGSGSAYTQTTAADITLANINVPGGLMGANGALRNLAKFATNNTAGAKGAKCLYASTPVSQNTTITSQLGYDLRCSLQNRGVLNQQLGTGDNNDAGNSFIGTHRVASNDTSISQPLTFIGQIAVATDYIILEGFTVEVLPA